jgi:hypothetical protein
VFVIRLNKYIPDIFTSEQHGFCPGRSTATAMGSIVPTVELIRANKEVGYICAVDVNKAYDCVNR